MALTIRDPETEALVAEIAGLTGESKTATVRRAVRAERARLRTRDSDEAARRAASVRRLLAHEIWPTLELDAEQTPLTKAEREEILGYGSHGV